MIKKTSAALVGLLVLASPLVLTLPWKEWLTYGNLLRSTVNDLGAWAPVLFTLVTALGTALGLPRLIFCTAGGWLFGLEWGFGWSHQWAYE